MVQWMVEVPLEIKVCSRIKVVFVGVIVCSTQRHMRVIREKREMLFSDYPCFPINIIALRGGYLLIAKGMYKLSNK